MENTKDYYSEAVECFGKQEYDLAIQYFIKAYETSDYKEEILDILYQCYSLPNEDEFKKNYEYNSQEICKIPYDELAIDFFAVSDTKYYLFDRGSRNFIGEWDIEDICNSILNDERELEFGAVLVAEEWDMRDVLPIILEKRWETIYWLIGDDMAYFASFLKLPQMRDVILANTVVFDGIGIFRAFFEAYPDFYLPRYVVAKDSAPYSQIIDEIHETRLKDTETKRNNILLSICMPTYRRGQTAYENVMSLLEMPYDAEVEIVVSNNGSKDDYYDKIGQIKDSRITYHAFDENQHFKANVIKTLELANGRFAIMTSDEDHLIKEQLEEFLKYISNHSDCSLISTGGYGNNFSNKETRIIPKGIDSLYFAMNNNYMTGICYNKSFIAQYKILEELGKLNNNLFYDMYPHCVVGMYLLNTGDMSVLDIKLWDSKKDTSINNNVIAYMWLNSRVEQKETCLEICDLICNSMERIIWERSWKTYFLLKLAFVTRYEEYSQYYSWREICNTLYQNDMKCLEKYSSKITDKSHLKDEMNSLYLEWLMDTEVNENGKLENKIINEIIKQKILQKGDISEEDVLSYEKEVKEMLERVKL